MKITQCSRISHHTIFGATGATFSVPLSEDFTDGSWSVLDLALSEIGINEDDGKAYIRIGSGINEIMLSGGSSGGWPAVLSTDNTSGANDAIMNTGQVIKSGNGGGQLDLDYGGSSNEIVLSTDNGSLFESYLYLSQGNVQLKSGNGSVIDLGDAVGISSTAIDKVQIITGVEGFNINTYYNSALVANAILFKDNRATSVSSASNDLPSILIATNNSTVNSAIVNSVIVGGNNQKMNYSNSVAIPDIIRTAETHAVTTTNATVTTLYSFMPDQNGVFTIEGFVNGLEPIAPDALGSKIFACFNVDVGVVTQLGTSDITIKNSAGLATATVNIDTDGTNIRVRVTGIAATTIDWTGVIDIIR